MTDGPIIVCLDDDVILARAFYEAGREMDGRTFTWEQLSGSTRERYRQCMRTALTAVAND